MLSKRLQEQKVELNKTTQPKCLSIIMAVIISKQNNVFPV